MRIITKCDIIKVRRAVGTTDMGATAEGVDVTRREDKIRVVGVDRARRAK